MLICEDLFIVIIFDLFVTLMQIALECIIKLTSLRGQLTNHIIDLTIAQDLIGIIFFKCAWNLKVLERSDGLQATVDWEESVVIARFRIPCTLSPRSTAFYWGRPREGPSLQQVGLSTTKPSVTRYFSSRPHVCSFYSPKGLIL